MQRFYHDLVTEESWKLLLALKKKYGFILIGGWAVYLYTKSLKSKDIDMVVDFPELEKLRRDFQIDKNDRLKKYEGRRGGVQIDIYVPFYSNLGLPVEDIGKFTTSIGGFRVPVKELLAILKGKALSDRADSVKGRKDLIDLVSLFALPGFDWGKHGEITKKYKLEKIIKIVRGIIAKTSQVPELDLNIHKMARLKKTIKLY